MEMDYDRYDEWDKSLCDNCKRWTFDEFHSADGDIEISSLVFGFWVGENFQNKNYGWWSHHLLDSDTLSQ